MRKPIFPLYQALSGKFATVDVCAVFELAGDIPANWERRWGFRKGFTLKDGVGHGRIVRRVRVELKPGELLGGL